MCPVVSFVVFMDLAWLWRACLLMLRAVFLFCGRISMVYLAVDLVGSWVDRFFTTEPPGKPSHEITQGLFTASS